MESRLTAPTLLKTLRETSPLDGKVLTVYLDTSPKRQQDRAYLLSFRDLARQLRGQMSESERKVFDAAETQVQHFLERESPLTAPGLAIFASGAGYFHAVPLPRRPREEAYWEPRGHLLPLQSTLDEFERAAIVLFDAERARLFTVYLGAIEEHLAIDDAVPPKYKGGGWAALSQSRIARHRDDHLLRHAKHTVAALTAMHHSRPFDRLLIGGPDESLAVFKHVLPLPMRQRVAGTLRLESSASDADVLHAALPVLEAVERRAELTAIEELLDEGIGRGAAIGPRDVLPALSVGRVHVLYIAASYAQSGGECELCGRLVVGPGPCPDCGVVPRSIADLGERALELALGQSSRVEVVSGDADALLQVHGGLGAWVRGRSGEE